MDYLSDKEKTGTDLDKSGGNAATAGTEKNKTNAFDLDRSLTHADYQDAGEDTLDGRTINAAAIAAAGRTTGDRDIQDGERAQNAERIDIAVRSNAAWLETRPVEERFAGMVTPVIHVPGT